jgi:twitching motility protein PilT
VDLMNRDRSSHIVTIEDPIEFVHESRRAMVTQRQVRLHTESFRTAVRAALREDPDVVVLGELRDPETVALALDTAETGHLVLSTMRTNTAAATVDRLLDQVPAERLASVRGLLAESLRGVISQTLCRRIGGGRVAAREVLLVTPAVANLIREGKTFQIPAVMHAGRKSGMVTLNDALLALVEQELVEPAEAYLRAIEKATFATALKQKRIKLEGVE